VDIAGAWNQSCGRWQPAIKKKRHSKWPVPRAHISKGKAILIAQDLLASEESLSGSASEPYLRAVQTLDALYESNGGAGRASPLRLHTVVTADLVSRPNDARRGFIRVEAARALAR